MAHAEPRATAIATSSTQAPKCSGRRPQGHTSLQRQPEEIGAAIAGPFEAGGSRGQHGLAGDHLQCRWRLPLGSVWPGCCPIRRRGSSSRQERKEDLRRTSRMRARSTKGAGNSFFFSSVGWLACFLVHDRVINPLGLTSPRSSNPLHFHAAKRRDEAEPNRAWIEPHLRHSALPILPLPASPASHPRRLALFSPSPPPAFSVPKVPLPIICTSRLPKYGPN